VVTERSGRFANRRPAGIGRTGGQAPVRRGLLRDKEDVVDGLESAPEAFLGTLDGKNFGKLLVRVS
jgi:NADPH-dependent curcumin reductase CurA